VDESRSGLPWAAGGREEGCSYQPPETQQKEQPEREYQVLLLVESDSGCGLTQSLMTRPSAGH
jgi:hypothetical protein